MIGQQCVFVSANKIVCWPSVFYFCTSLVNAVLRLCSCFLRQLSEMLNFWYNSWIQSSWPPWLVFILWSTSFPQTWVLFKFFPQIFSLGLWHFFTNKFTILGLNILNLHNLSHVYFLPKSDMPEVKRALTRHLSRVFGAGKLTNHNPAQLLGDMGTRLSVR